MNPLSLLSLIPGRLAAELAIVAALAGFVGWMVHHERQIGRDQGRAVVQKQWDAEAEAERIKAQQATEENRVISAQREEAQKEISHVAQIAQAHHDADVVDAARSHQRLLDAMRAAPASGSGTTCDSSTAGGGIQASAADDLRTRVLDRIDGAASELGGYADQLAIALSACQSSYQALKPEVSRIP